MPGRDKTMQQIHQLQGMIAPKLVSEKDAKKLPPLERFKREQHGSFECDECDGSGRYYIDGKSQRCICAEDQAESADAR